MKSTFRQKRLFGILASFAFVCLCLLLFPNEARAETEGYFTYTVYGGKATLKGYSDNGPAHVEIPATLGGYPVTEIRAYAFWKNENAS